MGGFQSKSSEETAATNSNEGSIQRSANDGAIVRFGNDDGAIVRSGQNSELKGSSEMIMSDRDSKIFAHGLRDGFLLSSAFLGGVILVVVTVAEQFTSYLGAKMNLEWSEMVIPKLQAKIRDRRSKGVPESDLLKELEVWEKERESAVVYMKKHKLVGKIVEMLHPKN